MNANELAVYLEDITDFEESPYRQAATMLRQQQAEIEALKMDIHSLTYGERLAKYFNKPIAWIEIEEGGITEYKVWREPVSSKSIPLYTHPAKTLTDEEIDMLVHEYNCIDDYPHEFVRACIRKAQEK